MRTVGIIPAFKVISAACVEGIDTYMNKRLEVLNGSISLHQVSRIYVGGKYERRMFLSCQNEREVADMRVNNEQIEELIKMLQEAIK